MSYIDIDSVNWPRNWATVRIRHDRVGRVGNIIITPSGHANDTSEGMEPWRDCPPTELEPQMGLYA